MKARTTMLKKILSLPVQVLLIVVLAFFLGPSLPLALQETLLAISLTLKEILLFFLPALIFSFLFLSLSHTQKGVFTFVFSLLILVCFSNFFSTMVAYSAGQGIFNLLGLTFDVQQMNMQDLAPLWTITLPKWIPNEGALFLGFCAGIFSSDLPKNMQHKTQRTCQKLVHLFLHRFFIPLVPLFILGFIIKLQHDGTLFQIFYQYGPLLLLIACLQMAYIMFLYALAAGGKFKVWRSMIRNMFPAFITSFSAMSSAAALPLTLRGSEKNTKNDPVVEAIVPATVNVHLIGDSIGVPLMAMGILLTLHGSLPPFETYMIFAFYFIVMKFAIAAVPGGGIIVMVPILEKYLGFSPEMAGLITAIYILFDPINTGFNVLGNGAFAILFQKFWRLFNKKTGGSR